MTGEDIRFHSDLSPARRFVFLGKAAIYSAGATFMSFFAIPNRYLTRGTRVMIHERKMDKMLHVAGPLTTCVASVRAVLHELEHSIAIHNEGFENLVRGSQIDMDEVLRRLRRTGTLRPARPRRKAWSRTSSRTKAPCVPGAPPSGCRNPTQEQGLPRRS